MDIQWLAGQLPTTKLSMPYQERQKPQCPKKICLQNRQLS